MNGARMMLGDLAPLHRAEAERQLRGGLPETPAIGVGLARAAGTPAQAGSTARQARDTTIKQSSKRRSGLERDFEAAYTARGHVLSYECMTLVLANGCRYTPDYAEVTAAAGTRVGDRPGAPEAPRGLAVSPPGDKLIPVKLVSVTFYECKGRKAWDDAVVKLKVAARQFPHFRFVMVTMRKSLSDPWVEYEVKA
jgi:hypothetical protein